MNNITSHTSINAVPINNTSIKLANIMEDHKMTNEHLFTTSPAIEALQISTHRLATLALLHDDRLDAIEKDKEQQHKNNDLLIELLTKFDKRITALEEVETTDSALEDDESNKIDFSKFSSMKEAYHAGLDDGQDAGYISGVYHCEAGLITTKDLESKYGIQ